LGKCVKVYNSWTICLQTDQPNTILQTNSFSSLLFKKIKLPVNLSWITWVKSSQMNHPTVKNLNPTKLVWKSVVFLGH